MLFHLDAAGAMRLLYRALEPVLSRRKHMVIHDQRMGSPQNENILLSLVTEKQSLIDVSACLHACAYAQHAST
jgi:hypothetical protein